LQSRTIPFNIDGKTVDVECIVTEHGDTLVSVIDYVAPFTGCDSKDASSKFSSLYNAIPMLRPAEHELRHYSKVRICCIMGVLVSNILVLQAALEFMCYVYCRKLFTTLEGLKTFTNSTRSGKLDKKAYPGQDKLVVDEAIALRRKMAIDEITTGLQQGEGGVANDDDTGDDGSGAQLHALQEEIDKLKAEKAAMQAENDKLKQRITHDARVIPTNLNIQFDMTSGNVQVTTSYPATGGGI